MKTVGISGAGHYNGLVCTHARKREDSARHMSKDLTPILEGWDYDPARTTVRKIAGLDDRDKIQMRLQLGLLQMEATGRPDGRRPHGCESLLEHFERTLEEMRSDGREEQFELRAADCAELRDEALQYYYRYVSLFSLEEYADAARDTQRNLRAFDLVKKHAVTDADKFSLEQHRPYVVMMNSRARANLAIRHDDLKAAYDVLHEGMDLVRSFFLEYGQPGLAEKSDEYKMLSKQADELKDRVPRDPLHVLRDKLRVAVEKENFEEAARLRNKIQKLEQTGT